MDASVLRKEDSCFYFSFSQGFYFISAGYFAIFKNASCSSNEPGKN